MERTVRKKLFAFLEDNDLFPDSQHGLRSVKKSLPYTAFATLRMSIETINESPKGVFDISRHVPLKRLIMGWYAISYRNSA